jgi:hypothetical protein
VPPKTKTKSITTLNHSREKERERRKEAGRKEGGEEGKNMKWYIY